MLGNLVWANSRGEARTTQISERVLKQKGHRDMEMRRQLDISGRGSWFLRSIHLPRQALLTPSPSYKSLVASFNSSTTYESFWIYVL